MKRLLHAWNLYLVGLFSGMPLFAAVNTFTNGTGDGLWATAANWSLGRLPNTGDEVVIPAGRAATLAGQSTSFQAENLTLESGARLVFDCGRTGVRKLLVVTGLSLAHDSAIVVDGTSYQGMDGYFPLIDTILALAAFDPGKVSFTGFDERAPAVVVETSEVGLRLAAPKPFSKHLGTLVPPSTVEADYEGSEFSATRELQPTVSAWTPTFPEAQVMDAEISSHVIDGQPDQALLSWAMRIGRGGHIYSLRTPALGETVPPSYRADPNDSPWNDEVWQGVAVDTALNRPDADPPSKYFLHQSGVYMRDPMLTEPFYSPMVAWNLDAGERSYTVVNWIQHPHLEIYQDGTTGNDWRSDLLVFTRFRDLGKGVIEVSMGFYNYGKDTPNRHNMPWGGVRRTSTEYAFVSNPGGTSWTGPINGNWGVDTTNRNFDTTGGWFAYSDSPTGASPALGLVHGRDAVPNLPSQWRNSLCLLGYAGGTDNGTETGWRNYLVSTVVRHYTLNRGSGVWSRYYFVLGGDLADLAARIQSRGLAAGTELQPMDFPERDTPVIGYGFSGSGSGFAVFRSTDSPAFHLYAHPVNGSLPLYHILEGDGTSYLTWDPYATGVIKTYDGTIAGIRLLGFALRAGDANRDGTDFAYADLESLMAEAPGSYLPAGEDLVVRTRSAIQSWRLKHFGDPANSGDRADSADFDGDGASNFLEYALGGDPTQSDLQEFLPTLRLSGPAGSSYYEYMYRRRRDRSARLLTYTLERSVTLMAGSWMQGGEGAPAVATIDTGFELVTSRIDFANAGFSRLRVCLEEEL